MKPNKHKQANQAKEEGQGFAEYAIILILVGIAVVAVVALMQPAIGDVFSRFVAQAPVAPPSLLNYTPPPTFTSTPTVDPNATDTPVPSNTPVPSSTPIPSGTPVPSNTPIPSNTPVPTDYGPCTGPGCGSADFRGYSEPNFDPDESDDPTDRSLNIGDAVATSSGNINSSGVRTALEEHIRLDRTLRVIVWNESNGEGGVGGRYRISGFAIFRFIGYSTSGNWILAEFIRLDDSCGQIN